MLTQTVLGRVYDYSHAVGGRYIPQPVGLALGKGDMVYVLSRPSDAISGVDWNKTGVGCKITKLPVVGVPGDEEFVDVLSRSGGGAGGIMVAAGLAMER